MQLFGPLILLVTPSAAFGLRCHTCSGKSCTAPMTCPQGVDRCATTEANGAVAKSCMLSALCVSTTKCCETDLCNSATPTGSSVLLLLVSSEHHHTFSLRLRSSSS
ncbi:ly-6/neurotoxin-like protein 1 [Epinephelus moara]|uniref:ly-6/neurotoxin-like protein 1 n=1 Tax=Epinephelus moara TaxID=300413 RepID=UPI00214F42AE|nr:ly-6/neurotoxin-like protein 1 [Epinephelus moara]